MACGIVDRRTGVIPNGLVLDALAVVVLLVGPVTVFDDRPLAELGGALLAGLALSGAPLLFAVWLVAPRLIGGGDWKLLSVLGLAAGYLAPSLAMVVLLLALGTRAGRRRVVPPPPRGPRTGPRRGLRRRDRARRLATGSCRRLDREAVPLR